MRMIQKIKLDKSKFYILSQHFGQHLGNTCWPISILKCRFCKNDKKGVLKNFLDFEIFIFQPLGIFAMGNVSWKVFLCIEDYFKSIFRILIKNVAFFLLDVVFDKIC